MISGKEQQLTVIDYGFAKPYLDKDGNHISDNSKREMFKGNILFGSINEMNFLPTSRRDDLLSISYLMLFLFNNRTMPKLDFTEN